MNSKPSEHKKHSISLLCVEKNDFKYLASNLRDYFQSQII